jgi:hypothetical protein
MNKIPKQAIAFFLCVLAAFALLCWTALRFDRGVMRIYFEIPKYIKLNAEVNKSIVPEEAESKPLLPTVPNE